MRHLSLKIPSVEKNTTYITECLRETDERIIATIVRGSAAGTDVEDLMKTHKSLFCTAGQADETTGVHGALQRRLLSEKITSDPSNYYDESVLCTSLSTQAADAVITACVASTVLSSRVASRDDANADSENNNR